MPLTVAYPDAFDSLPDPTPGATLGGSTPTHTETHAFEHAVIERIEEVLGLSPQGGSASVAERLAAIETAVSSKLAASALSPFGLSLVDDANATAARGTLELGNAATRNVGSGAGSVAAGDDARLSDARPPTAHGHDAAEISGLGAAALLNVGTTTGTVAAGDDPRFSGGSSVVSGFVDVDFGTNGKGSFSAAASIVDALVTASAAVTLSVGVVAPRALDELENDPLTAHWRAVPGVGIDLLVSDRLRSARGVFRIGYSYTR